MVCQCMSPLLSQDFQVKAANDLQQEPPVRSEEIGFGTLEGYDGLRACSTFLVGPTFMVFPPSYPIQAQQ